MLTNPLIVLLLGRKQRVSKTKKQRVLFPQPNAITNYSRNMGGIDKFDCNTTKYRIKIRDKERYFSIFNSTTDIALVEAHTVYCIVNENIPLLNFRRYMASFFLHEDIT
ncbi:chimeric ERCC6-PGBD3 protein [Nephila pilipes]|uniref:Chimeric ERCC6-PGBD3 protein n=1 Tax=Nephila pilipes TaxID=299642 RepID=A0A8X6PV45_NEPPI|nr:chimeric ERCC6-PGBD3 protein [Nephila pilipes]